MTTNFKITSKILKDLKKKSWWLQNTSKKGDVDKNLKILKSIDAQLVELEKTNSFNLQKRANNIYGKINNKSWQDQSIKKLNQKEREYERQLFSFFAEILVASDFYRNKKITIEFISEIQYKKTPDFVYKKNQKKHYIEVKNIRDPFEENEKLRSKGIYSSDVNHKYPINLLRKILDFLDDTDKKFKTYQGLQKNQKILVLNYNLAIDTICCNYGKTLDEIYGKIFFNWLESIYCIKILRKNYFDQQYG